MKLPFTIFLALAVISVMAQTEAVRKEKYNVKKNVAIDGYDPVSYFEGEPKEGKDNLSHSYRGITYLFSSTSNQNKFKTAPDKYEPAYGGWCAYAMGETGEQVKIDPETFKILNGKLYLFYNFWGNNTLEEWNKHENKLKQTADTNWQKTLGK
jgi:YHS domain-containing protein